MAGNEGRTAVTAAQRAAGPSEWGRARRLAAALLVACSMVGVLSVVLAGATSAQTDAVLQWLPEIQAASAATGVPAEYIAAVIRVESVGDPNAVSSAGAIGLMQVMPAEFQSQGIAEGLWYDPATNILAGSTEIGKFLTATGSIEQALASYFGSGCDSTGTCTDGYISIVLSYAASYAAAIGSGVTADVPGVATSAGTTAGSDPVDAGMSNGDGAWSEGPGGDSSWNSTRDASDDAAPGDGSSTPIANGTPVGDNEPVG